jgi:membrane associated rhomboid family serine protease
MRLRLPPATLALIGLTAGASGVLTLTHREQWAVFAMSVIPARFASGAPADFAAVPALLTPLSATLVHSGYVHLSSNLAMLLVTGSLTERALGWRRTLMVYLAGAYAAALAQWAVDPQGLEPMVGASGAIAAFVGAQCALYGALRAPAIGPFGPRMVQIAWQIAAWTLVNLLGEAIARREGFPIAWAAHVGGFVAGILMARPLLFIRLRESRLKT